MRIGIQTWGSTGDIRPMIALAGGLSAAGHDVTVVATSVDDLDYRPLARSLGVACTMVPEHPRCDIRGLLLKFGGSRNELKLFRVLLAEILYPFVEEMHRAATALVARSDLVIGHFAVHPLKAAAAKARKPHVAVCYWPGLVPTAARAPFPLPSLGRTLNRLAWGGCNRILNRGMLRELALAWTREGLAPPASVIPGAWFSDSLNLLAASPLLWPAPPEWGDLYRVCGAFDIPAEAEPEAVPPALDEFLAAGDPPVFMSFGSSQLLAPERDIALMLEAARLAGVRAIIHTNLPEHPPGPRDGRLYFVGRAPHRHLFPRCAAIVLHGGAGTTHAVARSGRPAVVVGFSQEQTSWGAELCRLGAACPPLRRRTVTPAQLAARLRDVLGSPALLRRAEEVGQKLRQEDGVAAAVRIIEDACPIMLPRVA